MLQDTLKLAARYLSVGVHNELIVDSVEHDPSPRPLFIFRVAENAYDAF